MGSIRISKLKNLNTLVSEDFFPLDDSSSLITNRVSILDIGNWMKSNGSASISYNSLSSSFVITSSFSTGLSTISVYSISSSNSLVADYVNIPPINFVSHSLSSSWASSSLSSSYALSSSWALFPPQTFVSYSLSSSWTSASIYSNNADTSDSVISSSYARSASLSTFTGGAKAYGSFSGLRGTNCNDFSLPSLISNVCYNISSITYVGGTNYSGRKDCSSEWDTNPTCHKFALTFQIPMLNTNYNIIGSFSAYSINMFVNYPYNKDYFHTGIITMDQYSIKTINNCTISVLFFLPTEGVPHLSFTNYFIAPSTIIKAVYTGSFIIF